MEYLKNHTSASRINNESGVLLIEVIISVGIAGILMLSLLSMMQLVNQNSSRVSLGVSKNELINRIRFNALSLPSMESSAKMTLALGTDGLTPNIGTANNLTNFAALADCMPTVGTSGTCNKSSMDDPRGFRFYLAGSASEDPTKAVAGEDVYYTVSGIRCDQTKAATPSECPIMAMAWAEPFCSNFATTCNKALSLTIRYRVGLRPDFTGNMLMAPIEGEIYMPLTKGIQLSRLLSQLDNPISMNSSGIYSVQKYYGYADQATQPTGLRFEAILGNPTGLGSMKLQYRAITGTAANSFLDETIPSGLTSASWVDVEDPLAAGTPWAVDLTGAKPNQIINFGTQAAANTGAVVSKNLKIGATSSESAIIQSKYRWTIDGTGNLIAPTFKSGFYQFRVLATDINGGTIESMNYITVRIVPRPQFLAPLTQPSLDQTRNCITTQKDISYSMGVADDEGLGAQTLKLNGTDVAFTAITGTNGFISFPFDLSQSITGTNQLFGYSYTAKNKFTDRSVNNTVLSESSGSFNVKLSEKTIYFQPLSSSPSKIRINTTGTVMTNFETGSCCNETPTVNWTYPSVPEVSAALLSGNTSSVATCNIDTSTNKRTCSANVVVTGVVESPSTTSSPDISSVFTFSSGANACTGGTSQTVYNNNAYVPVVRIPGIQFYLTESLWLTIPNNPILSVKTINPRVYVRADFQPDEDVTVGVYRSTDNSEVCTITFSAGSGTSTIDRFCDIPAGYSGDLALKRVSANVMIDTDAPNASFRAKLVSGKLNHRTCQPNLASHPEFANYPVSANQPMLNSPWGFTTDGFGNPIQDVKNDAGQWPAGSTKYLRCYDSWSGTVGTYPSFSYNNGTDLLSINTLGTFDVNVQDNYRLNRYNTEPALKPYTWYPNYHITLGASSGGRNRYQTYIFPDNPNLDFDPKNAPWVFVVWNNGSPGNAIWQYVNPGGATSSTPPKSWTNFSQDLCTGSAQLSTIKLWGTKSVGHSTAETVMKATNNVYAGSSGGYYSYTFMCAYGRWNPFSKTNTSWTN